MAVIIICPKCNGTGKLKKKRLFISITTTCKTCNGSGKRILLKK